MAVDSQDPRARHVSRPVTSGGGPDDPVAEGPAFATAVPAVTVPELIRARARAHPERTALIDGLNGRRYTYQELDHCIGRMAAGLAAQGFKPGDTLLMFAPNCPEWPIAALGAMAAGGVVSGANPQYSAIDLAHQIRDASARFVVTIPGFLPVVRAAAGSHRIIVIGGEESASDAARAAADEAAPSLSFASLLASTDPEPAVADNPDALAALPYSSGTTGLPKGVMLTHRNIVANVYQCDQVTPTESAVLLAYLPMFHIYGLTIIAVYGLAVGATLITLPRFEPATFLRAIEQHRVTHLHTVPPVLQFLAQHPLVAAHDLSSLEWIMCGAAPLGGAMERLAGERLQCHVAQGFGMTESSGVVAATYPKRGRLGASGQLLPGTQARIVDPETGSNVATGVAGELWFRGPQAFQGYLNRAAETAATITPDRWVRTGDIGYFDADGYLWITDRLKELIKVKGFQVPPAELEALLVTHPSVADAAVIGRPCERSGEIPVAYILARGECDGNALKAWVAERVVDYKQLGDVVLCDAIPKTASGKILRRVLRVQDAQRPQAPPV